MRQTSEVSAGDKCYSPVRVSERERECVRVCVRERERKTVRERVCVSVREREIVSETERARMCVCMYVSL